MLLNFTISENIAYHLLAVFLQNTQPLDYLLSKSSMHPQCTPSATPQSTSPFVWGCSFLSNGYWVWKHTVVTASHDWSAKKLKKNKDWHFNKSRPTGHRIIIRDLYWWRLHYFLQKEPEHYWVYTDCDFRGGKWQKSRHFVLLQRRQVPIATEAVHEQVVCQCSSWVQRYPLNLTTHREGRRHASYLNSTYTYITHTHTIWLLKLQPYMMLL